MVDLVDEVIGIGKCTGTRINKFKKFKLTAEPAQIVKAPLIRECYANYECRVADRQLLKEYNFFILEVVKARAAVYPKYPKTIHYRGEGVFMVAGRSIALAKKFKSENL